MSVLSGSLAAAAQRRPALPRPAPSLLQSPSKPPPEATAVRPVRADVDERHCGETLICSFDRRENHHHRSFFRTDRSLTSPVPVS